MDVRNGWLDTEMTPKPDKLAIIAASARRRGIRLRFPSAEQNRPLPVRARLVEPGDEMMEAKYFFGLDGMRALTRDLTGANLRLNLDHGIRSKSPSCTAGIETNLMR
jgi:hypothetical protein